MNPEIAGLIRHALTTLGGALVAYGYMDAGTLEAIAGGLAAIIGVAWSLWAKRGTSAEAAKIAAKV